MKFPFRTLIIISIIGIIIVMLFASTERFEVISEENYIAPFNDRINLDVVLYFPYDGSLRTETHTIPITSSNKAESIIDAIIDGPKNSLYERPLKSKSQIISVLVEGNTCYISLSGASDGETSLLDPDSELQVWAIVNAITDLAEISYVQFLVNGEKVFTQISDYQLYDPLPPRVDLVYKRELTAYTVVTNFFENINNNRYDLAYDLLSTKSQGRYSYQEFIDYMNERNERFGSYQQEMTFTRKIDADWVVSISYRNTGLENVISELVEHLRVVRESGEYKIDL